MKFWLHHDKGGFAVSVGHMFLVIRWKLKIKLDSEIIKLLGPNQDRVGPDGVYTHKPISIFRVDGFEAPT